MRFGLSTFLLVRVYEDSRRAQFAHGQESVQGVPLSLRSALALFVWPCEVRALFLPIPRSGLERDCCSRLEPFWRVRVFFPHSARPGVWWPNARSSGFARLAFSGRLSSFAALPNEGAPKRSRWVEYFVMSDSVRASVLPIGYHIPDRCGTESA